MLENLHWEHARLVTALPGIRPCAFVEGRAGAPFRLPMHADTLWIDTDRGVCTLVWRRQVPLDRPDEQGRVVVAMEQPGQTLSWADVAPLLPEEEAAIELNTLVPPPAASERTSAALRVAPPAAALPFYEGAPSVPKYEAPASASKLRAPGETIPPSSFDARPKAQTLAFLGGDAPMPSGALPFVAAPPKTSSGAQWPTASQPIAPPRPTSEPEPYPMAVPLPPPSRPVAVPATVGPSSASPWSAGVPSGVGPARATIGAVVAAEARPVPRPEPLPISPASARGEAAEILELLWFESDSVPRIRRNRAWKPILTALEQRPVDRDLDDPALADDAMEMEDRREVFEVLAQGSASDATGIDRALDDAVRKDGKFVAQLALFSGQLEFLFDELETVKATVATVAPLVTPTDEPLKAAVDAAKAFLETADELTPPSVAEGMTARIREAFAQGKRTLPETHLVEQTSRVLLAQRRYQTRIVFGAPHLRCLVHLEGAVVPGYLPSILAKKLPMYQRFKGRFIAEVHQQADQYETFDASLRFVALARASARRSRG